MKKETKEEEKPTIKVYSTQTCPYCFKAKDFLKEKGVEFEDIDVSVNQEAAHEMIEKSGQMGVPVIDINGKIIVGFDQNAIEEAISKK
ncbi:glutathione S-transferase N-terminal domain-containing protein [Candidatus Woesearchaeota archaeon]|nr:glutathione S-transferase N-terminal domain-containing protein [Candidatus Woesearchaeota archaeon]